MAFNHFLIASRRMGTAVNPDDRYQTARRLAMML